MPEKAEEGRWVTLEDGRRRVYIRGSTKHWNPFAGHRYKRFSPEEQALFAVYQNLKRRSYDGKSFDGVKYAELLQRKLPSGRNMDEVANAATDLLGPAEFEDPNTREVMAYLGFDPLGEGTVPSQENIEIGQYLVAFANSPQGRSFAKMFEGKTFYRGVQGEVPAVGSSVSIPLSYAAVEEYKSIAEEYGPVVYVIPPLAPKQPVFPYSRHHMVGASAARSYEEFTVLSGEYKVRRVEPKGDKTYVHLDYVGGPQVD